MWRLMPFLFLLYIVAYLDRINVSFAIVPMADQFHLTDRVYGRAAGMFFAGYFFFQVPSNLILERVGVRRWISGLMVVWGMVSGSMSFIRGPTSFYTLRFLLGAAEAGFFPGMILYLKHWFPANARARAVAWFMTANPRAGLVGSPISGALLGFHGRGLAGWQWLFLLDGMPAILLGAAVFWVLVDSPRQASWLTGEQRDWLVNELERERQADSLIHKSSLRSVFTNPRVWILSLVYFGIASTMYGVTLWLPSVIRALSGLGNLKIGMVAAIPYLLTAVAMVIVGRHSAYSAERRWHTALSGVLGPVALGVAAYAMIPWLGIVGLSVGMMGAQAMGGPFWAMARTGMAGSTAAPTIAVINSVGNLGGCLGASLISLVITAGGEIQGGLLAIGSVLGVSACLALAVGSTTSPGKAG